MADATNQNLLSDAEKASNHFAREFKKVALELDAEKLDAFKEGGEHDIAQFEKATKEAFTKAFDALAKEPGHFVIDAGALTDAELSELVKEVVVNHDGNNVVSAEKLRMAIEGVLTNAHVVDGDNAKLDEVRKAIETAVEDAEGVTKTDNGYAKKLTKVTKMADKMKTHLEDVYRLAKVDNVFTKVTEITEKALKQVDHAYENVEFFKGDKIKGSKNAVRNAVKATIEAVVEVGGDAGVAMDKSDDAFKKLISEANLKDFIVEKDGKVDISAKKLGDFANKVAGQLHGVEVNKLDVKANGKKVAEAINKVATLKEEAHELDPEKFTLTKFKEAHLALHDTMREGAKSAKFIEYGAGPEIKLGERFEWENIKKSYTDPNVPGGKKFMKWTGTAVGPVLFADGVRRTFTVDPETGESRTGTGLLEAAAGLATLVGSMILGHGKVARA
jgi:hypothetical protein